jgi:hypothetical protein
MRRPWASTLLVLALIGTAGAGPPPDRLERFKQLARQYADAPDPASDGPILAALFGIADGEVTESLASGGPFASTAFIRERLDAFGDEWGGASFMVLEPAGTARGSTMLGLYTVTRGEPRASLRIYGTVAGEASLLAASTQEGIIAVHPWPARAGAPQFLASWIGAADGRGARPLHLELWRRVHEGARGIWRGTDLFPAGLRTTGFAVTGGRLAVRYEIDYPGWKPGCGDETEQEDVYSDAASGVTLVRRRVVNSWHRELQSAATRLFDALRASDGRTLAELVPDSGLRARLPRDLRAEAACDERDPAAPGTAVVAATSEREDKRVPWSLTWRRDARGWRLTAAAPVLQ